jgi:hypothetical protein
MVDNGSKQMAKSRYVLTSKATEPREKAAEKQQFD